MKGLINGISTYSFDSGQLCWGQADRYKVDEQWSKSTSAMWSIIVAVNCIAGAGQFEEMKDYKTEFREMESRGCFRLDSA